MTNFMTILWIFLFTYPFAFYCWHVWCYLHRSIHLFTRQMFSVRAVQRYNFPPPYNDIICLASPQSVLLFVFSDSSSHVCATSQKSTTHSPKSHFLQKYNVLPVFFCSEHTWHRRGFPLEGQCCECFTSSRLSWDAVGLGLPLEMPLAVTFSSLNG